MEQWIQQTLSAGQSGLAVFPAVFLLGVIGAVSSCCTLPALGAIAGYSGSLGGRSSRRELLLVAVFFMAGTILSMAVLGAATGFVGQWAGTSLGKYWRFAAGLVMVLFGLAGLRLVPWKVPKIDLGARAAGRGATGAVVYGLAVGGATTACSVGCNPLLPLALGTAVLTGLTVRGAAILSVFALGYSLPMAAGIVGIGLGLDRLSRTAHLVMPAIRVAAGVVLIGVGFYLLATV